MSNSMTPGPWKWRFDLLDIVIQDQIGSRVATLPYVANGIKPREMQANAAAITALPDLIEAAKKALKALSQLADVTTENRTGWAHKALAEALGKAGAL